MPEATRLCDLFQVSERFRRSVNIALDFDAPDALKGYVLTHLSKAVLERIGAGLAKGSRTRSWSVTGPYGAGKSACMLFIAQLLSYPPNSAVRSLLEQQNEGLSERLVARIPGLRGGGFAIVPMVGSRQPMSTTLLKGLLDVLATFPSSPELAAQAWRLRELQECALTDPSLSARLVDAVLKTAQLVHAADPRVEGLLLIWDELGKSLEYAALNPEQADIGLLQSLAEMAARSDEPVIGLLTILHQAFEHYAATLSPSQQREWNKVQGRFEDIGFLESQGELLALVGQAIRPVASLDGFERDIRKEAERAADLEIVPRDLARGEALQALTNCAPLHPTVALVLGPLFRSRLAQNERSLFAFLGSGEPYGFQEFLHQETWRGEGCSPFYRLDGLYDYVVSALGSGLYIQGRGKYWAEIEEALGRLPKEASPLHARLIKAIGMLNILGDQRYLRASADVLSFALADGQISDQEVLETLEQLVQLKIAIYQNYRDAYGLWQGSDIDLDARFEQGLAQTDPSTSLAALLQERGELKPYVAKRHLHQTGSFRFLTIWLVDLDAIDEVAELPFGEADGAVVFVLNRPGLRLDDAALRVASFSAKLAAPRKAQTFFAIPRNVQGIREAINELMAWQWVAENTPELEGDRVARRELAARRMAAHVRLERALALTFGSASSHRSCLWVWKGKLRHFASARDLASAISDACDEVYAGAPLVKNELINRRSLSSAAAAARRALIERMLANEAEERLGLAGFPPEASIYLSVLRESGLHQFSGEAWSFGPPPPDDPCRMRPLWDAMDRFLTTTEDGARPVADLYDLLSRSPYGVKAGLWPLFLAVALIHWRAEVALYEEGSFVPEPGIAELERLMRAPERFAIQRYRLDDARSQLLWGYLRLFKPEVEPAQATALNAVRALISFTAGLPRYAHLTEQLSPAARAVRRALTTASEPQPLLFAALPKALGRDPEAADGVEEYLERLKVTLLELQQAYDQLLGRAQRELVDALRLPADLSIARPEIARRTRMMQDWVTDMRLRAFILRLADGRLPDREWLESVASGVARKPPATWNDSDEQGYRIALAQLAEQLRRTEDVALARGQGAAGERAIRLGVTDGAGQEWRDVLHVAPGQEGAVARAVEALQGALDGLGADEQVRLAALAELAKRLLDQHREERSS